MISQHSLRIDGLRVALNWLVVILHAWAAFQYVPDPTVIPTQWNLARWLSNSFAISLLPVLFYLSGLLYGCNYDGRMSTTKRKIKSRIRTLLVPYLLWNATFVMIYLFLANWVPRLRDRVDTYELNTIWGCVRSIIGFFPGPIDGPLWFVRNLFLMVLMTPLLYLLLGRFGVGVLAVLGLLMLALSRLSPQWNPYCLLYFAAGLYAAMNKRGRMDRYDRHAWYILPGYLVASILYCWLGDRHTVLRYVYFLGAVPFWLAASKWLVFRPGSFWERMLQPASFFVYASHFLFCSMLMHFAAAHLPPTRYLLSTLYFVFTGLGGLACLGVFWTLRCVAPTLCAWYSGGRGSGAQ
jgi:fucose 4-O-acetylase-like acetyltransferase